MFGTKDTDFLKEFKSTAEFLAKHFCMKKHGFLCEISADGLVSHLHIQCSHKHANIQPGRTMNKMPQSQWSFKS